MTKRELYLTELTDLQVTSKGLAMREMSLTVKSNLDKPNIQSLRNPCDTPKLMAIINFAINRASKINSTYKPIDEELSISLTVDLMEKMGTESIDDILLMFKMARTGDLEISQFSKKKSFYEAVLQDWVPAYLDLKSAEMEKRWQNEKTKSAEIFLEGEDLAEYQKKIRSLRMSIKPPEHKESKSTKILIGEPHSDSPLKNDSNLIATFTTLCKKWSDELLKETIEDYKKYNDKKRYVYIFENELNSRK